MPATRRCSHQRCLTEQFAPADQVPNGDVEVGVSTAPVGDLGEGVSSQDVLGEKVDTQMHSLQIPPQRKPEPSHEERNKRERPALCGAAREQVPSLPCLALPKEALEAVVYLGPNIET